MPLEKKEMDEIFELKSKKFLSKMEEGKFYSLDELAELIMNKSVNEIQGDSLNNLPNIIGNTVKSILETTYVQAVVESQYATGNLKYGEKDKKPYYSRV